MNKKLVLAALAFSGMVMLGCEEKKDVVPAPTAETKTTADQAADQAKATADAVKDRTDEAAIAAKDAAKDATAAAGVPADVKAQLGGEPQELLDKAMQYVKENKLADAEAILVKLESVKGKLPAEWAGRIEGLRSAINAAKGAAGALPGGAPAMPGGAPAVP